MRTRLSDPIVGGVKGKASERFCPASPTCFHPLIRCQMNWVPGPQTELLRFAKRHGSLKPILSRTLPNPVGDGSGYGLGLPQKLECACISNPTEPSTHAPDSWHVVLGAFYPVFDIAPVAPIMLNRGRFSLHSTVTLVSAACIKCDCLSAAYRRLQRACEAVRYEIEASKFSPLKLGDTGAKQPLWQFSSLRPQAQMYSGRSHPHSHTSKQMALDARRTSNQDRRTKAKRATFL